MLEPLDKPLLASFAKPHHVPETLAGRPERQVENGLRRGRLPREVWAHLWPELTLVVIDHQLVAPARDHARLLERGPGHLHAPADVHRPGVAERAVAGRCRLRVAEETQLRPLEGMRGGASKDWSWKRHTWIGSTTRFVRHPEPSAPFFISLRSGTLGRGLADLDPRSRLAVR